MLFVVKDDFKLLLLFLLFDGVISEKEDGKNFVEKVEIKIGVLVRLSGG